MKKLFYMLIMLVFTAFSIQMYAADTFYVNPATGNNNNSGTAAAPWSNLNPEKWTDDCTVIVLDEVYVDPAIDVSMEMTFTKITIKGGNEKAALMGLNDDEFEDTEEWNLSRMFLVDECELTLQDITLKNMKRDGSRGVDVDRTGGMIFVGPYGTLNFDNVTLKNSILMNTEAWGGAINSEGKLNIKNSVFENCIAYQGGVFYLQATETPLKANFEQCTFRNNSTNTGQAFDYPGGGVFWVQGNDIDITFDACYFESNSCENAVDYRNARGGAIRMQDLGENISFVMKNSTAANNHSDGESGFMDVARNTGKFDFSFINNVFYKNSSTSAQIENGHCLFFTGVSGDIDATGSSLKYINNTSLFNNNPNRDGQSAYYTTSWHNADAVIVVNNLFLDRLNPDGTAVGHGFVVEEGDQLWSNSYIVQNNIMDGSGGTGGLSKGFLFELRDIPGNENYDVYGSANDSPFEEVMEFIGLNADLTVPAGGGNPYAEISYETGLAVNAGRNSVVFDNANVVPDTDIRGYKTAGDTKDIGSFEYNGINPSGISNIRKENILVYPNPFTDKLYFMEEAASVNIYDLAGRKFLTAENVSSIDTSELPAGMYIIKMIDKSGNEKVQKIQK